MTAKDIQKLAEEHGLLLTDNITFNDMGIDFRVVFATDMEGKQWLLRIPRRTNLGKQIEKEKRILQLVQKHCSVQVPNWQIATPRLVAYPLLKDQPALTFDAKTYEVSWHMDPKSPQYVPTLATALVELHSIPEVEVVENDLQILNPEEVKREIADRVQLVKAELGMNEELETRYKKWLDNDNLWPGFTRFIHGDLYAGHVMTSKEGVVSGIIDWSTAHVSDPAIDFSGHMTVFGEESLRLLIAEYEKQGGKVWDNLFEQAIERAAAAPLAYGFFAVETQDERHISGAKAQLNPQ